MRWIFFLIPINFLFSTEIHQMSEATPYLEKGALVIVDIDNTLLEPVQELGNDQWLRFRVKHYQNRGLDYAASFERALPEWVAIQNITKVKAVESTTPNLLGKWQQSGHQIMALSTRGLGMATRTIEQLHSLGMDITVTSPTKDEKFFMNEQGVLYRKGILFTAGSNKGKALFKFLQMIEYKPKSIVFINDKQSNIQEVEYQCNEAGIPFTGLRYAYLDKKVQNFRVEVAEIQFDHFGHILSDEAAEAILESSHTKSNLLKEKELLQKN